MLAQIGFEQLHDGRRAAKRRSDMAGIFRPRAARCAIRGFLRDTSALVRYGRFPRGIEARFIG
jgi:hypothetical protein